VPGESTFRTRYDFVGGGGDHLDRLHSVVRPLRDAHSIALEDLRRAELEAIPCHLIELDSIEPGFIKRENGRAAGADEIGQRVQNQFDLKHVM